MVTVECVQVATNVVAGVLLSVSKWPAWQESPLHMVAAEAFSWMCRGCMPTCYCSARAFVTRLHEDMLREQGVLPRLDAAQGLNRYREETAPVPQYIRAVGAPLPRAAGTGVHATVQREIENLLAGECAAACFGLSLHDL